jgi:SAM-dependent methyltransferase
LNIILEFFYLFLLGIYISVYNFFLSSLDVFLITKFLLSQAFKRKILFKIAIKKALKFLILKFLFFYEYFLLPPRWISYLERRKMINKQDIEENLTHGETPYLTIFQILNDLFAVIEKNSFVFIDLGCGVGKTVFLSNILFDLKSIGTDIISLFIKKANKIKNILKLKEVNFLQKDISEISYLEYSETPIFYIASTAFENTFFDKIIENIVSQNEKAIIITLSKIIKKEIKEKYSEKKNIFTLFKKKYYFSWGKSTVYTYLLINKNLNQRL